ncbi:MAG TPA: hypothetical protein VN783_08025 [Thermoanaerobaculia bacterium]|nr:hypothetical protein [Thermoanaerobaculia bacterium]
MRSIETALLSAALAVAAFAAPSAARAGALFENCRTNDQPAATLLFPYFRVDLGNPAGATTILSVGNAFSSSTQARVVLWTSWGVPTLAFDLYLTGYDLQTINLRDLFRGQLPRTGADVSPVGPFSLPKPTPPGCGDPAPQGLGPLETETLRAAHSGRPIPLTDPPACASSPSDRADVAVGYVTVDAVNRCTPPALATPRNTPADPLYFSAGGRGLASDANVLWGDSIEVDPDRGFAASDTAVHVVADASFFAPGDYTFYGRFVGFDARDDRAPLSSLYQARLVSGGGFGGNSELVVWRDTREPEPTVHPCGEEPRWAPLGEAQIAFFDEQENPTSIGTANAFPFAVQRVPVGGGALPMATPFGWTLLDLWHDSLTHAQAWVVVRSNAGGRNWVSRRAVRADDLCTFGP